MTSPAISCEACQTAAEIVVIEGEPDLVRCPICSSTHSFADFRAFFPELGRMLNDQITKDLFRPSGRRKNRVRKSLHGFTLTLET